MRNMPGEASHEAGKRRSLRDWFAQSGDERPVRGHAAREGRHQRTGCERIECAERVERRPTGVWWRNGHPTLKILRLENDKSGLRQPACPAHHPGET